MIDTSIQVLAVTMNLTNPEDLCRSLNIKSSFVIGNQTKEDKRIQYTFNGFDGIVISRNDVGVGNNRNETLKYATSDICLLADDDMSFHNNYCEIVKDVFEKKTDADVIIFNIDAGGETRRQNTREKKISYSNYMNYGAARIAFRRKAISYNSITFNTNFGGGTIHSAGEDVLFISDCLKKGLKIIAVPVSIASLKENRESTWFKGYNDKYLFDKGVFLAVAHRRLSFIFALYLVVRHKEYRENSSLKHALFEICKGIDYIRRRKYL